MLKLIVERTEIIFGWIAAFAMAAIMVAVSADAFMRYGFNAPIQGTQDLVGRYLMVGAYFAILSQSYSSGAQIRIDFLLGTLPERAQHAIEAVGCAGGVLIFGGIAWIAAREGAIAWTGSEIVSGPIAWPIWITHALVVAGTTLLVLRLLINGAGHLASTLTNKGGPALPSQQAGH